MGRLREERRARTGGGVKGVTGSTSGKNNREER